MLMRRVAIARIGIEKGRDRSAEQPAIHQPDKWLSSHKRDLCFSAMIYMLGQRTTSSPMASLDGLEKVATKTKRGEPALPGGI
jgi:hypothetical protein